MTRFAVIADSHFDETSRFEECVRVHEWIAEDAKARGCTAWLHAGDVFERRSTPRERAAVASWIGHMCSRVGDGVIVRGNHDAPGDLAIFARLNVLPADVHVVEDARVVEVAGVSVACLAWPRKASLLAAGGTDASEALRGVLRGLDLELAARGQPAVLLAHAMMRGSVTSTGQPLVGHDMEIGIDDLVLLSQAKAYLLGHIHKGQDWEIVDVPAIYPGSPRRTNFGELEPKGYVVLDVEGYDVRWERVATPATPMVHVEEEWGADPSGHVTWLAGLHGYAGPEQISGAEVRFRYRVPADRREAAAHAAREVEGYLLSKGAASVKVEEIVVATTRARTPEVAAATTLGDRLAALWRARSDLPEPKRAERLIELAARLDEEVRHAS